MSTNYYELQHPITSLRLNKRPAHHFLTIWERGQNIGTLCFTPEYSWRIALMFSRYYSAPPSMRTSFDGKTKGLVVTEKSELLGVICDRLTDDTILVTENGSITTAGEVRARSGAGAEGSENDA